ncbi:MAG: aminotransferase class I/II-fold pyridoxal phosphate-dependent enzyme [Clostridiales bacterium]|nr:aminotransferase class I/II-fold pyridoxal phosphate-dependent enzyme [Clostridiales bacterium]
MDIYKQDIISFHTPGHKNARIYDKLFSNAIKENLINIDTTEIIGTDNLHNAIGIINDAQKRASEIFKSEESYFLVNGSTSGIYSMIMGSTSPGDRILIDRNCHQSVINALILGDLIPEYIYPDIDINRGIPLGISPDEVEKKLKEFPDAKAVIITYPTYHGIACDLKKIADIVHKYNKILLVDEAHGAHLGLSKDLPRTALESGADMVVQSIHKTLPALTQASILHIQGDRVHRDRIKFMLKVHQSSSPSYILMSSLDLAINIYEEYGQELMSELLYNIDIFKSKIKSIDGIDILDNSIIGKNNVLDIDKTKLWISLLDNRINGYDLENRLRSEYNIQMELSNIYGVLALTTIGNEKQDFEKLYTAFMDIVSKLKDTGIRDGIKFIQPIVKRGISPRAALYADKKILKVEESIDHISGQYLIPYPPGVPLLIPGEIIDRDMILYVKEMLSKGMEIMGLRDKNFEYIEVIV